MTENGRYNDHDDYICDYVFDFTALVLLLSHISSQNIPAEINKQ